MSKQANRPARFRSRAGRASPPTVQYTVRSVPAHVDKALRRKAREERKGAWPSAKALWLFAVRWGRP